MKFSSSQPGHRREDLRFLVGKGRFAANRSIVGHLHLVVVRSIHAHADINAVHVGAAEAMPGVVGVMTSADLDREGVGCIPCDYVAPSIGERTSHVPPFNILARDRIRYVGQAVAAVVAESPEAALTGAESVEIEYAPLAAVVGVEAAVEAGSPLLWDEASDNVAMHWRTGDAEATAKAFATAEHVVSLELVNNRVSANPMEPRCAIGSHDEASGAFTLHTPCQGPFELRRVLADNVLRIPRSLLRVVPGDVGGGFGMKGFPYPEQALVLLAARRFGRPVVWRAERTEALLSDYHARDHLTKISLALDGDGRFLALEVETLANVGAVLSSYGMYIPTSCYADGLPGSYVLPAMSVDVRGVFTNTSPVDAYRGAGRAEGTYAVERVIDMAAETLGIDPAELRLRNILDEAALPYRNAIGQTYDSGGFGQCLRLAAEKAEWASFPKRRESSAVRARLRGIGIASYVMPAGYASGENAEIRVDVDGSVTVCIGNVSCGQGHETAMTKLVSEALGVNPQIVRVIQGDTERVSSLSTSNAGSHFLQTAGPAAQAAVQDVIEKGRRIAAHLLEVSDEDLEFSDADFVVGGTDRRVTFGEVAAAAHDPNNLPDEIEPGLGASRYVKSSSDTFPCGCHVAEVEIDPETGEIVILTYVVVNDFGRIRNRQIVSGQVHGGVAQGLGQALMEHCVYDADGQLLSGSFLDYAIPRANDVPTLQLDFVETPAKSNPLGVKGCGEAGATSAPPAIANAILDALRPLGVRQLQMPMTSEKIWRAIREAQNGVPLV